MDSDLVVLDVNCNRGTALRSISNNHGMAGPGSVSSPIKPESVFWRLKTKWIPFALTGPAIYHANLYLASTFQDRLRARIQPRPGMAIESRATLYHQAHAAHYISQKIARSQRMMRFLRLYRL
jgi:hypothetical protein